MWSRLRFLSFPPRSSSLVLRLSLRQWRVQSPLDFPPLLWLPRHVAPPRRACAAVLLLHLTILLSCVLGYSLPSLPFQWASTSLKRLTWILLLPSLKLSLALVFSICLLSQLLKENVHLVIWLMLQNLTPLWLSDIHVRISTYTHVWHDMLPSNIFLWMTFKGHLNISTDCCMFSQVEQVGQSQLFLHYLYNA